MNRAPSSRQTFNRLDSNKRSPGYDALSRRETGIAREIRTHNRKPGQQIGDALLEPRPTLDIRHGMEQYKPGGMLRAARRTTNLAQRIKGTRQCAQIFSSGWDCSTNHEAARPYRHPFSTDLSQPDIVSHVSCKRQPAGILAANGESAALLYWYLLIRRTLHFNARPLPSGNAGERCSNFFRYTSDGCKAKALHPRHFASNAWLDPGNAGL